MTYQFGDPLFAPCAYLPLPAVPGANGIEWVISIPVAFAPAS